MKIYTIQIPYQNLESQMFKINLTTLFKLKCLKKDHLPGSGFVLLENFGSSSELQKYMLDA